MKYLALCAVAAFILSLSACTKEKKTSTVAVTAVSLNKQTLNILVNNADSLKASVSPADATNGKVTWSTSNSAIATVDASGHISTKALGNVTITATSQDGTRTASCLVKVQD